jgi:tetratricopeptide (TPR) repeat protein
VNWASQINQFKPLSEDDVPLFASPGETEQAISIYNKAINNWQQDSQDIAIISLRKLASTYPRFPQPALMLGYCLASLGDMKEAFRWVNQAIDNYLPESLQATALESQKALTEWSEADNVEIKTQEGNPKPARVVSAGSGQILEKTRRHRSVRMASEREKKRLIRQGDLGDDQETFVRESFQPADLLQWVIPAAAVLIVVLLVLTFTVWIPNRNKEREIKASDSEKLAWLLNRIESLSEQDERLSGLLESYQQTFEQVAVPTPTGDQTITVKPPEPTPQPTPEPTPSPLPTTTATPTPTRQPTPTADPAVLSMQKAVEAYDEALQLLSGDVMGAAGRLLEARSLLVDLPDQLSIDAIPETAGGLRDQVEAKIAQIAVTAANQFRRQAEPLFQKEQYEDALVYYLKAYELNPDSYGGGVAYYTGRCYQLLNDKEAARPYFEYVVRRFAGRDIARSAAFRLQEMGY